MKLSIGTVLRNYFKEIDMDRNDVISLYWDYLDNLAQYIVYSGVEWQFLSYQNFANVPWDNDNGNSYIDQGNIKIGTSIKDNGTFWPLFYYLKNNSIEISEGTHRIEALRSINCDKKILGLRDVTLSYPIKNFNYNVLWPDKDIDYLISDRHINILRKDKKDRFNIDISNTKTAKEILILNSMFLSELFYISRPYISGAQLINDHSQFLRWYYSQIRRLL